MQQSLVFVPGIGFRQPGVRLAREARVERDGVTLTVTHFTAAPEGGDLTYEISDPRVLPSCGLRGDRSPRGLDQVAIFDGETEFRDIASFSLGVLPHGIRQTLRFRRLPTAAQRLDLRVKSQVYGEWIVPLDLTPFGHDDAGRSFPLAESAEHEGITIHIHAISLMPDVTAIAFEARGTGDERVIGVGGMHGMRAGEHELRLRDARGREYAERAKRDAREPMGRDDLAIFEPVPADASELELVVPFVCVAEPKAPVAVALPVTEPTMLQLGRYSIRVMSTGEAPDSPRRRDFGPALAVQLDLGGWQGDRRVLFPEGVLVDGQSLGMGYGNGVNATAPVPVDTIEVRMPDPSAAKVLTFLAPVAQVRGPWHVRFRVPTLRANV